MYLKHWLVLLLGLCLIAPRLQARNDHQGSQPGHVKQSVAFDLGIHEPDTVYLFKVKPNTPLQIDISSMLPTANYAASYELRLETRPPLEWPAPGSRLALSGTAKICDTLEDVFGQLVAAQNEADVGGMIAQLKGLLDRYKKLAAGSRICDPRADSVAEIIPHAAASYPIAALKGGETAVVTIVRSQDDIRKQKKWQFRLEAERAGNWSVLYGFSFISPGDHHKYFSKQTGDSLFLITKEVDRVDWTFAPTIMFNYTSSQFPLGLAGGLGLDLTKPVVLGGVSLTIADNLALIGGVAWNMQQELRGRYKNGDTLTMSLDDTQLHEEQYRTNLFISIAFRFDKNPFGGADEKAKKENEGD